MDDKFLLDIISPLKLLFSGPVLSVTLAAVTGSMTVLADHAPVIALLDTGDLSFIDDQETKNLALQGGFMSFSENKMTVLVNPEAQSY